MTSIPIDLFVVVKEKRTRLSEIFEIYDNRVFVFVCQGARSKFQA